jgi:hypothetical protein
LACITPCYRTISRFSWTPSASFGTSTLTTNANLCQWTIVVLSLRRLVMEVILRVDRVYMDGQVLHQGGRNGRRRPSEYYYGATKAVSILASHPTSALRPLPKLNQTRTKISKGRLRTVIDGARLSGVFFYLCLYLQCQTGISMPIKG